MTGRVRERFTRTNGELLFFPHGHDLLGNWTGECERETATQRSSTISIIHICFIEILVEGQINMAKVNL